MTRSFGTFGLWGGMWIKGTVMYAYTGKHIIVSSLLRVKHKKKYIKCRAWYCFSLKFKWNPTYSIKLKGPH